MLCKECGNAEYMHGEDNKCYVQLDHGRISYYNSGGKGGRWDIVAPQHTSVITREEGKVKFHTALEKMREVHDKKSQDYANEKDRYSNFEYAAKFAGVTVDQVFAVLIGVKEARLLELSAAGKTPVNEAIEDTRLDAAVYAVLRYSYHQK